MRFHKFILEATYTGNIGFAEMVSFFQKATDSEITAMEKIVKKSDWNAFKKIIEKVLGKKLK
jgi:hypothetical protein